MTDSSSAAQTVNNPYASSRTGYYALCILTIVYSINFIDRQLLSILQESIKADLMLSDAQLGLLTGFAFAVFYTFAGLPIASLADRSNRRNIVAVSLTVWSGMTALSGMAQNYGQLLAARVGVGIGEAGGSPPSHSMISDIFPPEKRASAIGFYSTGISIGILFGFLFGGWLNEFFGWRVAFFVVGVPGVLIAIVLKLTVPEPIRGLTENRASAGENPSMLSVFKLLLSRPSFMLMALGAAMNAFAGYSSSNWIASFMIRTHQMPTGELGTWLALIIGVGGAIGVFSSGVLADKLGKRDKRWYMWVAVCACAISIPFQISMFLVESPYTALLLLIVPAILSNAYLGATIACVHSMVGLKMRAVSSALLFFILNMIGLGLGPTSIGLLSDTLADQHGVDSLGYAMMYIIPSAMFISGIFYLLASRYIRDDLAKAPD
ncbi:MFS transporter [Luminiphilus sp.]|jgi:predicted MFS family arabinose efflux permease|nr:MFS transporter [Luminiphilus sp.]MDB2654585.1 MFS transporter [Luminiphilus sp.]MDB2691143.1 MFS transporter [Luminiphilus sp.]